MQRFKNILFSPVGRHGNPAALRRVSDLFENNGSRVTVLGVVAEPSRLQKLLDRRHLLDEVLDAERTHVEKDLKRMAGRASLTAETVVQTGDPALRIVERVLTDDHDLVVVTSDEDREDHATIRRLLRTCPCPVWVIRPTRARTQRVLAAVNPDADEIGLNLEILELAFAMHRLHGGELHVVHAWELFGEATMRSSAFMHVPPADMDELLAEERSRHGHALDALVGSIDPTPTELQRHLVKGPPDEVVPAMVTKHRINLLVMGTVARTGVTAMVMGNTAERVLDRVNCSVVALKPAGFVSPIREST